MVTAFGDVGGGGGGGGGNEIKVYLYYTELIIL